jgi:hypothetical protein
VTASAGSASSQPAWTGLSRVAYRTVAGVQILFGLLTLVGVVAFAIFVIYFIAAFRDGAAASTGAQTVMLNNKSQVSYVTPEVKRNLDAITRFIFATLFPGIAGGAGLHVLKNWLRHRYGPHETGRDVIDVPRR